MTGRTPAERIEAVLAQAQRTTVVRAATDVRPFAVGWASVELERAERELATSFGFERDTFVGAADSVLLGAKCRVATGVLPGGLSLAVLEPVTEGRLVATLARFDEGPAVLWSAVPSGVLATIAAPGMSAVHVGPFGRERLLGSARFAPLHRLLIEVQPVTIATMTEQGGIALRRAEPGDAEAIATMLTDEGYPAGPSDIAGRLQRFASDDARVIVAEHEGALLGFIAIHALPRFEHEDRLVRILAVVVDAGARERGVGRALMGEAERVGRELGAAFIELTAGHHRPEARQLYETLGYDASVTAYLRKKL